MVIAFEEDKQDLEARKLGLIVFGAIQQKRFTQRWGLMFTDIKINGQKIEALVDTEASDLLLSNDTTK